MNTSLLPIVDVCMYGGALDRVDFEDNRNDYEREVCEEDGTEFIPYDLDYEKYDIAVLEVAASWI